MPTRLCLTRHGETDWNRERRIQGHTDIALNPTGQEQARLLADGLRDEAFDAIYASDLTRAFQTASACAQRLGLEVQPEPALRERHYGDFQGLTYAEAEVRFPDAYAAFHRRDPAAEFPGGGESLLRFYARVARVLDMLADRHRGGTLLVVTHGGVLDMAHRLASTLPLTHKRDFALSNATMNWLLREDGRWQILAWDERAHLDETTDELPG
ncbi:histidine phosphatase family protein [Niveibacterium sp. SC-1]|uniref:histidine phosphatase family protein n=1 Tax=Niveibacterium sp. SC-1 TaxID=3135646 RepID=UPI00311F2ACC